MIDHLKALLIKKETGHSIVTGVATGHIHLVEIAPLLLKLVSRRPKAYGQPCNYVCTVFDRLSYQFVQKIVTKNYILL